MKFIKSLSLALLVMGGTFLNAQEAPKREFRGAWLQTVYQEQFAKMDRGTMQKYLCDMLDKLQDVGINAIVFQVRPSSDAFYASKIEPWSRHLTGRQGKAPASGWDPMEFLIEECHKRNMEFHAWLNPYRVTTSKNELLTMNHIYHKNPEWFVEYDGKIYFDPGLPQSRRHIRKVVADIVSRYDVDAIHMDDYFYPYPVKGLEFPDDASFAAYHKQMGFAANQRKDWRRQNVNILIKGIREEITAHKPWVRFGISPFGIYRNQRTDPMGSKTNGLQNYDDLYADVLRWTREGWVDYMVPQVYWEIGHTAADYETLAHWWDKHANDRHMYIGQSISRSLDNGSHLTTSDNHFGEKIELTRKLPNISGNCFWYGYQIANNEHRVATALSQKFHATPALIPAYSHINNQAPKEVKKVKANWSPEGYMLSWDRVETKDEMQKQHYFCVYQFDANEKIDLEDGSKLIGTTRSTTFKLPYNNGKTKYRYVVTAVDRMHNESTKGTAKKIKL